MKDSKNSIVCFGEVLWDVYLDTRKLGGAPFNVAAHLSQLGSQANIITRVGADSLGDEIIKAFDQYGIDNTYCQIDKSVQTGVVNVTLDKDGKPTYDIKQPSSWDFIESTNENSCLVRKSDALLFGSLACRTRANFDTLKTLSKVADLNICDLNIRLDYYTLELVDSLLQICDILKINDEEAELLCDFYQLEIPELYTFLSSKFSIQLIIQTLGAKGAEAYENGILYASKGFSVEAVDTVGSGDAFLASFLHHYLGGKGAHQSLVEGCKLGAYVATQKGAIPSHNNFLI